MVVTFIREPIPTDDQEVLELWKPLRKTVSNNLFTVHCRWNCKGEAGLSVLVLDLFVDELPDPSSLPCSFSFTDC